MCNFTHSYSIPGPVMPKRLSVHQAVIVLGGYEENNRISGSIFKFSCSNNDCKWDTLPEELKTPRSLFTAIVIPDDFIECN